MTGDWIGLVQVMADAARNLYGAGGGSVHPSAYAAALGGLAWTWAYQEAMRAGQHGHAHAHGGDETLIEEAFKESFAESLGWSDQQFEQFWNDPDYEFTASDARRYDETWDAWEEITKRR
jgi:hypothetical protein